MVKKVQIHRNKKIIILGTSVITVVLILVIGYLVTHKENTAIQAENGMKFQGFIEAQEIEVSAQDILNRETRPVQLKIVRKLDIDEYDKIAGTGKYDYLSWSYYEAFITYDYSIDEATEESIILSQFGNEEWQTQGDPLLSVDHEYVIFLIQNKETDGYWEAFRGRHSIYDVVKEEQGEYLYKRGVSLPIPNNSKANTMVSGTVITTNPENPVIYSQKITTKDFVDLIKSKIK